MIVEKCLDSSLGNLAFAVVSTWGILHRKRVILFLISLSEWICSVTSRSFRLGGISWKTKVDTSHPKLASRDRDTSREKGL